MATKQSFLLPEVHIEGSVEVHLYKVSVRSRIIYLLLISSVVAVLVSLPFIYVDVYITTPGQVNTRLDVQVLVAAIPGKVIFSGIGTDKRVNKGDTLLVIDTQPFHARMNMLKFRLKENARQIRDLKALTGTTENVLDSVIKILEDTSYQAEWLHFKKQYQHQYFSVQKAALDHARTQHLFMMDVISAVEYEASSFTLQQGQSILRTLWLDQQNKWKQALQQNLMEEAMLLAEINSLRFEIERCFLLSPSAGTLIYSADIQVGSQVMAHQRIAELSPWGDFEVIAGVSPADIGYLKIGQRVRVAIDAYNQSHWGMLNARLMDISDDVIMRQDGMPLYRLRCLLEQDTLVHRNGSVGRLRKGMTASCRIMQERTSLWHLVIRRIDQVMHPGHVKREAGDGR